MADYLQSALRDHPRTRRLGELIADFAYPITSTVLGSGVVPFPGTLRRGVDSLKQTSDYIFQPPYERLVQQIEDTRRMKMVLERRLLETSGEYEALRSPVGQENAEGEDELAYENGRANGRTASPAASDVVEDEDEDEDGYEKNVCTDPTHLSHDEHTAALVEQRRAFEEGMEELRREIGSLNTRVESLVMELARREGENARLRGEVERREGALREVVGVLEGERREREAEREREARVSEGEGKPMIDTTRSYDGKASKGIPTPQSLHTRELNPSIAGTSVHHPDPALVALPGADSEEEDWWKLDDGDEEDKAYATLLRGAGEEAKTNRIGTHHRRGSSSVSVSEGGGAVGMGLGFVVGKPAEKNAEGTGDGDKVGEREEREEQNEVKGYEVEAKKESERDESGETHPVAVPAPEGQSDVSPAAVDVAAGAQSTVAFNAGADADRSTSPSPVPTSSRPNSPSHIRTASNPPSSFNPSSIPVSNKSKHARTMSGGAPPARNMAFGSFGFGGPDILPTPKKNESVKGEVTSPGSMKRKKHSFFGRHDVEDSGDEREGGKGGKEGKEGKDKPSLRTRVFSTPSPATGVTNKLHKDSKSKPAATSGEKNTKSKSDEESSIHSSSGHSHRPVQGVNENGTTERAGSPVSPGKLGRKHSKFETYVIDPLERRASKIVHKGRDLLRHDSSHSLHREATGGSQ